MRTENEDLNESVWKCQDAALHDGAKWRPGGCAAVENLCGPGHSAYDIEQKFSTVAFALLAERACKATDWQMVLHVPMTWLCKH